MQFNGANIVTNSANLTLTGASSQIIDQNGNNGLANFATNASNGSFTINGKRSFTTSGNFTNAGLFTVASGSTFTVGGSGSLTQSAGTTTDDGTLSVGSLFNVQAGSLFGKGTVTGNVQSSGIVTPGDSSTATGILTDTGSYTQNSTGTLDISIGGTTAGTKFDELNSTTASLNGTLNISLINGFVPTVGSTFKIMDFNSDSGTFATVNGLSINSSEHFVITYQGTDVLLKVVSGPVSSWLPPYSRSWKNSLAEPWVVAGKGLSWYRGAAYSPHYNGEISPLSGARGAFPIAGKSVYAILQPPASPSVLRWNNPTNLRMASIPARPSWAATGTTLVNTPGVPKVVAPPAVLALAQPRFSTPAVRSPGLVLRQTSATSAPIIRVPSQRATFNDLTPALFRTPSRSIAVIAQPVRPVGLLFSIASSNQVHTGSLVPTQPILSNNFVAVNATTQNTESPHLISPWIMQTAISTKPSYQNNLLPNLPGSVSAPGLTAARNRIWNSRSMPASYSSAGYRNRPMRRSFSISLWNLNSKSKLGFYMP